MDTEVVQTSKGLIETIGFIGIAKLVLEVFTYISLIVVSFKAVQALNLYIKKNSK
jgi:hypothetical protein